MNKTVTVKVDGSLSDEIYNAGTMYEHNATTLVFEIDAQYISPQYRYACKPHKQYEYAMLFQCRKNQ